MAIRIEYKSGEIVGSNGVVFVKDVSIRGEKRKAIFLCKCGNEFTSLISDVKNGKVRSCGCSRMGMRQIEYKSGEEVGDNGIKFLRNAEHIGSQRQAVFLCPCGNEFVSRISDVKYNGRKSCKTRKTNYEEGETVGNNGIVFIKYAGYKVFKGGTRAGMATFMCECGNEFTATIKNVRKNDISSCGKCGINGHPKHGVTKDPMYNVWFGIRSRCYNKKNISYHRYGGRGIVMSDEFLENKVVFLDYIKTLKGYGEDGKTLDRIDNNGNYERGNLRWVGYTIQCVNQRLRKDSKSGYTGVHMDRGKWVARVNYKGKRYNLGWSFNTAEEAAKARDRYIIDNGLPNRLSGLPFD